MKFRKCDKLPDKCEYGEFYYLQQQLTPNIYQCCYVLDYGGGGEEFRKDIVMTEEKTLFKEKYKNILTCNKLNAEEKVLLMLDDLMDNVINEENHFGVIAYCTNSNHELVSKKLEKIKEKIRKNGIEI